MLARRSHRHVSLATTVAVVAALLDGSLPDFASATPAPGPTTTITSATATASASLTPSTGLLWGAHVADSTADDVETGVQRFEAEIGRKLDLLRFYSRWDSAMPPARVTEAIAHGRTPVWSISPQTTSGTTYSWASIAAGAHDADIVAHARVVASLRAPIFLIFHHEPDYATGFGTPAQYRAAYRHYVAVFRSQGVTNVAWTWVLSPGSFGSTPSTAGADAYYPGDAVVDWIGLDPYNWYGCTSAVPSWWRSLSAAIGPFHQWALPHGKPLMLAEWGSSEDPARPGRKAAWWTESMTSLARFPEIKAVLAFHDVGNCAWWVDSSSSSRTSFAAAGNSAQAHGRASAWLTASTEQGAAPLEVSFDSAGSAGTGQATGSGVVAWTLAFGDGDSVEGTGQPPAATRHVYAAGTWTATLTVRDATGSTNTDARTVLSAPAPSLTANDTELTASSVTLNAWVKTYGESGSLTISWGPTTAYGTSRTTALRATTSTQPVSTTLTGLPPGAALFVTITATTAGGRTSVTRKVTTPGLATFGWAAVSGRTDSTAEVSGGVNPRGLATTTQVEYGTTPALGATATGTRLDALTYEKRIDARLSGLRSTTTYYYRIVATNSAGTALGPIRTFTTLG